MATYAAKVTSAKARATITANLSRHVDNDVKEVCHACLGNGVRYVCQMRGNKPDFVAWYICGVCDGTGDYRRPLDGEIVYTDTR